MITLSLIITNPKQKQNTSTLFIKATVGKWQLLIQPLIVIRAHGSFVCIRLL